MDWQISPLAKASMWNGAPFLEKEQVTTLLMVSKEGVVSRYDLHTQDLPEALPELKGMELGRWTRRLPEKDGAGESNLRRLHGTEGLFFSLFGEVLPEEADEEGVMPESAAPEEPMATTEAEEARAALQHILALQLERKRILKPVGKRRQEGTQEYVHPKTRKSFQVPVIAPDEHLFEQLSRVIGELVF
jgi:hypothetical protein